MIPRQESNEVVRMPRKGERGIGLGMMAVSALLMVEGLGEGAAVLNPIPVVAGVLGLLAGVKIYKGEEHN